MGTFDGLELDDLVLTGPRVTLRPWRSDDADRVHRIMQDRAMSEFLALPDPYTRDVALRFVTELGDEGRRDAAECRSLHRRSLDLTTRQILLG